MSELNLAVWLYGSCARGQSDSLSDQDILVVADVEVDIEYLQSLSPIVRHEASVSQYTWKEFAGMSEYGSLFLHHLRLEAVPLYESLRSKGVLQSILENLKGYELAHRDFQGFEAVLEDIGEVAAQDDHSRYELAVLGTVIRHCSILGCWLLKKPSFSRAEPAKHVVSQLGLSKIIVEGFNDLYNHRLYIDGRVNASALRQLSLNAWLPLAREVVQTVKGLSYART